MAKKGLLIVISGPSGAGKGTVLERVKKTMDNVEYSISATTREPRIGEIDGKNYFFVSKDKFQKMVKENKFLEHQKVYHDWYGTPKKFVEDLRDNGIDVLLEIDTQGASEVMSNCPDSISIFLTPKDKATLFDRLMKRATESESQIVQRMQWAKEEYKMASSYDYVIINEDINLCVDEICAIIRAERCKTIRAQEFLENINKQF